MSGHIRTYNPAKENMIIIERMLNVAAVLGAPYADVAQYHSRFYFAAVPRDMLQLIVFCMEDCTVEVGHNFIQKSYRVCGVYHRFGSGPAIISKFPLGQRMEYYKYDGRKNLNGSSYIAFHYGKSGMILQVTRRWLSSDRPKRGKLPTTVINCFESAPYAKVSWDTSTFVENYTLVEPGDPLWDEVGMTGAALC